jgi:hypothetical protein
MVGGQRKTKALRCHFDRKLLVYIINERKSRDQKTVRETSADRNYDILDVDQCLSLLHDNP